MKRTLLALIALLLPLSAFAVQISVPSAPTAGYALVSTTTGAYIATTTDPFHVGSIFATSTAETSNIKGALTIGGNTTLTGLAGGGTLCLHVSNAGLVGTAAADCGSGSGNSFGYPFPLSGNATSSAVGFQGGLAISGATSQLNVELDVANNTNLTFLGGSPCANTSTLKTGTDGTFLYDLGCSMKVKVLSGNTFTFTDGSFNPWMTFNGTTQSFSITTTNASTISYASTTALSATSLYASSLSSGNCVQAGANGLLTTVGSPCGSGSSSFGYPFPYSNNTGTTTPILLMASTTIGGGTGGAGLTVFGNSTTTGGTLALNVAAGGTSLASAMGAVFSSVGNGNGEIRNWFQNQSSGAAAFTNVLVLNNSNNNSMALRSNSTGFTTAGIDVQNGSSILTSAGLGGGLTIGTRGTSPLIFASDNTEVARFASSTGYFGIGTTTPFVALDVATSSANASFNHGQIALTDSNAGVNLKHWLFSSEGGTFYLGTASDLYATSTTAAVTVLNNGNVGIGTSSPSANLAINAPAQSTPYFAIGSSTGTQFSVAPSTTGFGVLSIATTSAGCAAIGVSGSVGTFYSTGSPCGSGAAYPFALTGNATSTLTQFNGGLTAFSSSTIGNGIAGLTVNGNATTTGAMYVGIGNSNPYLRIGSTTPNYGYFPEDLMDAYAKTNDEMQIDVGNGASGSCASASISLDGNIPGAGTDFLQVGFANTGWTGVNCFANSKTGVNPEDAFLYNPTGNIDFLAGSTTATVGFRWFTAGTAPSNQVMGILENGNLGIGTTSPYALLSIGGNVVVGASTAAGTKGDLFLPKLGTPAGTFLAADPTGKVIATTSPSGSGITSITGPTGFTFAGNPSSIGTLSTGFSIKEVPSWTVGASGADFTTIQAAMTQCGAVGGGNIQLVDPSYAQGATGLTWRGSNCVIWGRGNGTTTISFTGATTGFKTNTPASGFTHDEIHNVLISGDSNASGVAINWSDMTHGVVDGVQITGFARGLVLNDTQNITFYNSFTNMDLNAIGVIGIDASSTNPVNGNYFNNIFIGSTVANVISFQMNNGNGNTLNNIDAEPGSISGTVGLKIFDNTLSTNNGVFNNTFSNWYVEANATGISVALTIHPSAGGIQRNTFNNMTSEANTTDWSVPQGAIAKNNFNCGYDSNFGNCLTSNAGPFGISTSTEMVSIGATPFSFFGVNASSTVASNAFVVDNAGSGNNFVTDMLINNSGYTAFGGTSPTARLTVTDQTGTDASTPSVLITGNNNFAKTAVLLQITNNNSSDTGTTTQITDVATAATGLGIKTTQASTTPIVLDAATKGSCIIMKDVAGTGYTQLYTQAGVLSAKVHVGALTTCN